MPASTQKFEPKIGERVNLFGSDYILQEHPAAPGFAYVAGGRKARVFQFKDVSGALWALKVFKKQFQNPELLNSVGRIQHLKTQPGLFAANRTIIEPADKLVAQYPELKYAILMPWLDGTTWADMLLTANQKKTELLLDDSKELCLNFLQIVKSLESKGYAHTDIAGGNVVFKYAKNLIDVQLLDLEDMYQPQIPAPAKQNAGTAGYQHFLQASCFCPEGDRFATAILSAELLVMSQPELARSASPEGYFHGDDRQARYDEAYNWLYKVAPQFTRQFANSWKAPTLKDCAPVTELYDSLVKDGVQLVRPQSRSSSIKVGRQADHPMPRNFNPNVAVVKWEPLTGKIDNPQAVAKPEPITPIVVDGTKPVKPVQSAGGQQPVPVAAVVIVLVVIAIVLILLSMAGRSGGHKIGLNGSMLPVATMQKNLSALKSAQASIVPSGIRVVTQTIITQSCIFREFRAS